ncbi:VWA domain-containing protein, partial [Actinomadura sp. HBU206391]|uniref:VWA domain-containing protein n=1 Tax=Actinomadura sp. HBU206391 TaxID=2731692 RepID=UPI00164EFF32
PQTLATTLRGQGISATPSWGNVLPAAGGAMTKNQTIPPNLIRIELLDPARNAAGMASLMVTRMLLANDPNAQTAFTGIVRTVRESTAPDLKTQFASFRRDNRGRYPIVLAPEQALWKHNQGSPAERAIALYPVEGTMALDYPFTITAKDATKAKAAKLLEQALSTSRAKSEVRALGFRSSDGVAPASFGPKNGLNPKAPRVLPAPQPADVRAVMQAWAKLSLSVRMLTLLDVSGSMAETVPGTKVSRIQATAQVAQGGLSLLPDDTELGLWTFSTELAGRQDWREDVTLGPLGQRIGSNTRRQMVLATLAGLRPKPNGDTGLYDSLLAAFRKMKTTYKPEMINSLLLLTDGKNDDANGISLSELRATLKKEFDPNRPVQVIMIGFGKGVDRNELDQIAKETRGSVHIANTPEEIQKIFLAAMSRRVCAPKC